MAAINRSIEQIRKPAAQLWADNATLESGQLAIESDTKKGKIGPGSFRDLPYSDFSVVDADADYANDQRDSTSSGSTAFKIYTAIVAKITGESEPVVTVGVNSIGAIAWAFEGVTEVGGTLASAFPEGTVMQVTQGVQAATILFSTDVCRVDSDKVYFAVREYDNNSPEEDWSFNVTIIIPA